jgi:predicted nucleic acid-binding protein
VRALAEGDRPWAIPVFVIPEFIKVATHPRCLTPPSPLEAAHADMAAFLASPSVRVLRPEDRFPEIYRTVSIESAASGQLALDAAIATVCLEHGVREILTEDRDFARFSGITSVALAT